MSNLNQGDLYKNNIEGLKIRFASLALQIEAATVDPHFEIYKSKSGVDSLLYNGKRVYSAYNPVKEITSEIEKLKTNTKLIINFGFGLGYLPLALTNHILQNQSNPLTNEKNLPYILCVEPSVNRLKSALTHIDIRPLLSYPNLIFFTSKNENLFLENLVYVNSPYIEIFKTPTLYETERELFQIFTSKIHLYQDNWEVNLNTTNAFYSVWIKNCFANIKQIQKHQEKNCGPQICDVKNLFEKFKGAVALLVAAGPSLDDNIEVIKKNQGRAVIICVDTALNALLKNGIKPDFLVTSDCQYLNSRHLDFQDLKEINIITELSIHHMLFSKKIKRIFLYQSFMPINRILSNFMPAIGELATGGSVATTAWDFANKLGVELVYCVGLDLCYPDGLTHSRYSKFEQLTHQKSCKTKNIENLQYGLLHSSNIKKCTNINGDAIISDQRMWLYKNWFETTLHKGNSKNFLLNSRGLPIKGFEATNCFEITSKQEQLYKKAKESLTTSNCPQIQFDKNLKPLVTSYLSSQLDYLLKNQIRLIGKEPIQNPGSQLLYFVSFDELSKVSSKEKQEAILKQNLQKLLTLIC